MIQGTCITKQKPCAGWNMSGKSMMKSNKGGGMAVILTGIMIASLMLLVFINISDYALYSLKRYYISRGIDYAVCAAVQEIDDGGSSTGLSEGYNETDGRILTDNIRIDELSADYAFFSTLQANTSIQRDSINDSTLIVIVNPSEGEMQYIIKKAEMRDEGSISNPENLEGVINTKINQYFDSTDQDSDRHLIHVNGNIRTNEFKSRPYYMVFIRNYQIDGLFRKRTATFVGFSGAKIERKAE